MDGAGIAVDEELKQIVEMERGLGPVPTWARQIVEVWIDQTPPCGHYLFPQPFLEIVSAIGAETASGFRHSCYTVQRERKKAMMDYCLCLDAWLAGASPGAVAAELTDLGHRKSDWHAVCEDLWKTLGEHTECKGLLVERFLHHLRWWTKFTVWDDDLGADFGRDAYLGDYSIDPETRRPAFDQGASPRIRRLDARLGEICRDWKWFSAWMLEEWWLCAPKAFRFLERTLWAVGQERPLQDGDVVPGFLQCEDTYPNHEQAAQWYVPFCRALRGWWQGQPEDGGVADDVNRRLGTDTPVKRWLVRLLLHKIKRLELNGERFTHLVIPTHDHRRGTGVPK